MNIKNKFIHKFLPSSLGMEEIRKRQFFGLCTAFAIPILIGIAIVDYIEEDSIELGVDLFILLTVVLCLISLITHNSDYIYYRIANTLIALSLLYSITIGAGDEAVLFWIFMIPLLFLFFHGKHEGGIWTVIFSCILAFVLLNPFRLDFYPYDIGHSLRFLTSFFFVSIVAYGLEASRYRYSALLKKEQDNLMTEKERLETAINEIKTLSGLLPICANCKKIRDDSGYWQEVEVYISTHSDAHLSHGICPVCVRELYPDLFADRDESD